MPSSTFRRSREPLDRLWRSTGVLADLQNEFFALLGPSGCGKTTLLRTLAGFEVPDSGSISLGGENLVALPPHRRPVNLMFQSYALFPHMSVAKNVAYGLERERLPKSDVAERVDSVLQTVGLNELRKRRPSQLSGGQRQRVALARAIVKRPKLLLLDEPLSALDKKVRAEMQLELKRLQHEVGITFIVVTHDQEEAMSMADRIAVIDEGQVQQVAPPVELYERPANLFVSDFIGTSNRFTGIATPQGVAVAGLGLLPAHTATLARCTRTPGDPTRGPQWPRANPPRRSDTRISCRGGLHWWPDHLGHHGARASPARACHDAAGE